MPINVEDTSVVDSFETATEAMLPMNMNIKSESEGSVGDETKPVGLLMSQGCLDDEITDGSMNAKTHRGGRTVNERPESPSMKAGRMPRSRRKTPTLLDDVDTKSDTTERSESPKSLRPQRTKRKLMEDGEVNEMVVINKRTRTFTEDSVGSNRTGNSVDSSEEELSWSDSASSKLKAGQKLKVNAKNDDMENIDRLSPRNRRPSSKLEVTDAKRSGRQSRSNSRGASDSTSAEDSHANGGKGKQTRAGPRETRKASDESDKCQPMNTRRNVDRTKGKEKSPPRIAREKSPQRARSRRSSPVREKREASPEHTNRRTTRSTKPKDNQDVLPPPATKRRRSSREHR